MTLDAERWRRARPLFEAARELPPDQRDAWVARAAAGDEALRQTVQRLLVAADAESDDFLPDLVAHLDRLDGSAPLPTGHRVGPYRLLRLLGMGGMGAVYLAERADGAYEQQVAVKLIRSGALGREALGRFRRERQILAWLNHPKIARLLDGGVTEAGPYLVMEYVEGTPIDAHCDAHGLGVRARIELFRAVCEAVNHAHHNLIVHRDLKPGNILVTSTGDVCLLDFGIARLLDESRADDEVTQTGHVPFTPEYASPEQIGGGPLSTASDVYSLGAVLYRLLTGRLPHQVTGLSPSAVERLVKEEPLVRPSQHQRELRGDLDMILLKTLHRDPARRYRSVHELLEDLDRHVERRPVLARPDTAGYRVSRFVRRHAMGVAATVVVLAAVVAGVLLVASEGRRAQRRFEEVRGLANSLLFDLHDAVRDLPGATGARRLLVSHALGYLDALRQEAPTDPDLQLELASAYEQIGEIQGDPHHTNLGDLAGALASYQQAFALRVMVWQRDTTAAAVRHALAGNYGRLAVVTSWSGDNEQAIALSRRALELLAPLRDDRETAALVEGDYGRIQSELGWWEIWAGRPGAGLGLLDSSVTMLERLVAPDSGPGLRLDLWRAYSYRVDGLRFTGRNREALALVSERALPYLQSLSDRYPNHPRVHYGLHVAYDYIGLLSLTLGDLERATPAFRTALAFAEQLVEADSANQKAFEALARSHASLGNALVRASRLDDGIASFERSAEVHRQLYARNPSNIEMANMLGNNQRRVCRILLGAARYPRALASCRESERVLEAVVIANRENAVVRANLGSSYVSSARVLREMATQATGDSSRRFRDEARDRYERGLALLQELQGSGAVSEIAPDSVRRELESLRRGS
jgi:non-specific serine/threonine protein kinase/serine/threonine-protein kinase